MATAGPSTTASENWEDELEACLDYDASWGDDDDFDRESVASSLPSDDDVFNEPDIAAVELDLMRMYITLKEWKHQIIKIRRDPIPQRTP
jgi:hypothetical protein